jgi:hypothetical protein
VDDICQVKLSQLTASQEFSNGTWAGLLGPGQCPRSGRYMPGKIEPNDNVSQAVLPGPQEAFLPMGQKYTAILRICTANSPFSKIPLYFRYFLYFLYTK